MAFDPNQPAIGQNIHANVTAIRVSLNALRSCELSATEPSNLVAGIWWFDTTSNYLKLRNEANTAWQLVWDFGNNRLPLNVLAPGELTADAAGRAKMADLFVVDAKINDVAGSKLTGNAPALFVAQTGIKTSIGSTSVSFFKTGPASANLVLPGGTYGFYPQVWTSNNTYSVTMNVRIADTLVLETARTNIWIYISIPGTVYDETYYGYAQQRYITTSGEVAWVFILRDKVTKQIFAMWQAPDHPCFGNGGKPGVLQHPFNSYDSTKHEIIVVNPSLEELEEMYAECDVEDETKPDRDILQVITEAYEIDETSEAIWPDKEVTVGLPKYTKDKQGKKILADYRFMAPGADIKPIKKKIPKPDYILCKKLKKK